MAITNTVLLNALADLADPNKDLRRPQYGATEAANKYKKEMIINYDEFNLVKNRSQLQTKQIDYLRRDTDTVNSTRAAALTGKVGASTRDSLTFVTYAREFTMSDDRMRNNTQAFRYLSTQIENARLDIGAEIEADGVTKLEAFKNTVQGSRNLGTWDDTNYVSEIALADKTRYYNYMATEMKVLDYNRLLQEIHTGNGNALIFEQQNQGTANSANLTYQFPDFEFYTSNSVTNLSDYFATSYVFEKGSFALVDWIPGKNREGLMNHADFDFTSIPDPFGIFDTMALAIEKTVADTSGSGGGTQDAVWLYELSIDIAYYIPTITTQKLINKYGLLSS